jgi:hypothetical protein
MLVVLDPFIGIGHWWVTTATADHQEQLGHQDQQEQQVQQDRKVEPVL